MQSAGAAPTSSAPISSGAGSGLGARALSPPTVQPQREANLRARLAEYTPAGMDGGLIFVS